MIVKFEMRRQYLAKAFVDAFIREFPGFRHRDVAGFLTGFDPGDPAGDYTGLAIVDGYATHVVHTIPTHTETLR